MNEQLTTRLRDASFNPFDPIQDTESPYLIMPIRQIPCFNPFDPIQDTESTDSICLACLLMSFQPIRSDTGY